jgi:general transcription factor 3C polypeptide 3 (transcription factor C subunit 4)
LLTTFVPTACAIHAERYDIVVEHARKLVTHHQFNNEPLRILVASLASGLRTTDAFITSTLQKHLFREMKLSDTAVKTPEQLRWNPLNKRYAPILQSKMVEADDDEVPDDGEESTPLHADKSAGPPLPAKENPVIIAIYGQICVAAKSYQSAICRCMLWSATPFADHLSRSLPTSRV